MAFGKFFKKKDKAEDSKLDSPPVPAAQHDPSDIPDFPPPPGGHDDHPDLPPFPPLEGDTPPPEDMSLPPEPPAPSEPSTVEVTGETPNMPVPEDAAEPPFPTFPQPEAAPEPIQEAAPKIPDTSSSDDMPEPPTPSFPMDMDKDRVKEEADQAPDEPREVPSVPPMKEEEVKEEEPAPVEKVLDTSKPLFVRVDDYSDVLDSIEFIKSNLKRCENFSASLAELNKQEEQKFGLWRKSIETAQKNFHQVDNILFNDKR